MRSRSKQRAVGSKVGADRLIKEEPHLSGAYIRSLVKQLTSTRNHASAKRTDLQTILDQEMNGENPNSVLHLEKGMPHESLHEENPNGPFQLDSDSQIGLRASNRNDGQETAINEGKKACRNGGIGNDKEQQPRTKKQVRRRLHTSRPYQERLLDMAEARREIVMALKFHRASMGSNPTTKPNAASSCPSKEAEKMKPRRNNVKFFQANNRCHACIIKPGVSRANEAKTITACSHLLCWVCLEEWLNFTYPTNDCPVCSRPLRSNDVTPLSSTHKFEQGNSREIQQPSSLESHIQASLPQAGNSFIFSEIQQDQRSISFGLSMQQEQVYPDTKILLSSPASWSNSCLLSLPPMDFSPSSSQFSPQPSAESYSDHDLFMAESTRSSSSWQITTGSSNSCSPPLQSIIDLSTDQEYKSWHVAMDDEELAEIRSIGDQYEMEWNDTINLVNSAWWFEFLSTKEFLDSQAKTCEGFEYNGFDYMLPALPSDSLWPDELLDSHEWDCFEFGDNMSYISEPSINSEPD